MDREEAIKILQEEIDGNLELTLREWKERDEQKLFPALRMAIEALSAEPTDLISRADAVDEMWKALYAYEEELEQKFIQDPYVDYADYPVSKMWVQNGHDVCHKAILSLPSAGGGWIPASERLPHNPKDVLTTLSNGMVCIGRHYSFDKWTFEAASIMVAFPEETVIAWMPLPEPYREDGEEDE